MTDLGKRMSGIQTLVAEAIEEKHDSSQGNVAFERIVRLYQDAVFIYALGILKNESLAKDVVQETLVAAYANLDHLRNPEAFWSWVRTITRRECYRVLRNPDSGSLGGDPADSVVSHHDSPEASLEKTERRSRIHEAIDSLPETSRIPIVLFYLSGHTQAGIADMLGLSLDAVKKRLQRGRERLKREMMDMIRDTMGPDLPSFDTDVLSRISLSASFEQAARLGQLGLVEAMLVDGIDIDEVDIKGRTLLHWAAESGHTEAAQLLLRYGANTMVQDRTGKTAGELAVSKGFDALAAMIRGWSSKC